MPAVLAPSTLAALLLEHNNRVLAVNTMNRNTLNPTLLPWNRISGAVMPVARTPLPTKGFTLVWDQTLLFSSAGYDHATFCAILTRRLAAHRLVLPAYIQSLRADPRMLTNAGMLRDLLRLQCLAGQLGMRLVRVLMLWAQPGVVAGPLGFDLSDNDVPWQAVVAVFNNAQVRDVEFRIAFAMMPLVMASWDFETVDRVFDRGYCKSP